MNTGSNSYRNALTGRGNIKSLSSLLLLKYHFLKISWKNLLTGVALEGQTQRATAELAATHRLRFFQTFQSADSKLPKYLQHRTLIVQSLCFKNSSESEMLSNTQLWTRASYPETPALQSFCWKNKSLNMQLGNITDQHLRQAALYHNILELFL